MFENKTTIPPSPFAQVKYIHIYTFLELELLWNILRRAEIRNYLLEIIETKLDVTKDVQIIK